MNETDHRVGLRKIPPELTGLRIDILRHQSQMIAPFQHMFEQRPRFINPPGRSQRVDIPERANIE